MFIRLLRGVAALVVLAALLVGAPLVLVAWMGNPWPPGGWAEVQLLTDRTLYGAVAVIGWIAWAWMTGCIVVEAASTIKSIQLRGLAATVNSDDPAYFDGYINENFTQVFAATGLTAKHAYQLAFNSFEASFAGNADKRVWENKLKETFERCVEHDY